MKRMWKAEYFPIPFSTYTLFLAPWAFNLHPFRFAVRLEPFTFCL